MNEQNERNDRPDDAVLVFDISPSESITEAVVRAVAAASNRRAIESDDGPGAALDPLYDVVDPDALDALFDPGASSTRRFDGEVRFTYHDQLVRVGSDGHVVVQRHEPPIDAASGR